MNIGDLIGAVWLFAFGAAVGSFLNVCIYRLPESGSLLRPSSHCPKCKHPIRWRDNVPILSYLLLRGRCRDCGTHISLQYPLVEFLTASLFVLLAAVFLMRGEPLSCIAVYLALTCILIVSSFIDLEHTIIPDEITIPGMILAPVASLAFPLLHHLPSAERYPEIILANLRLNSLLHSLIGMAAGAGFIYLMRFFGGLIFRKEAMGWGDVKFMGLVGGILGWKLVTLANLVAPVYGAVVGIFLMVTKGERQIPYGPFLSLGVLTVMIFGPDMVVWLRLHYFPLHQMLPG